MTLKFDGWSRKTIGHLFYTTLSSVHHSKAMGEFILELQSRNAQFGSKSAIFCSVWPWNMDDLEKKRAPLRSNIKLCASFHRHMWIQTGVTIRKGLNGFMTSVTLTFCMDITTVNGNNSMIRWQEHCQKGVMSGQTDRQMERSVLRAAWSQLKRVWKCYLWNGGHFVSASIC